MKSEKFHKLNLRIWDFKKHSRKFLVELLQKDLNKNPDKTYLPINRQSRLPIPYLNKNLSWTELKSEPGTYLLQQLKTRTNIRLTLGSNIRTFNLRGGVTKWPIPEWIFGWDR